MGDWIKLPSDFKANLSPSGDPSTHKRTTEQAREILRDQKRRFEAAHQKGMKAFENGDFNALDEAIAEEGKIIREQGTAAKKAKKGGKR